MKRSAGFTLLEVLVAISILALSMTAIFAAEGGAIKMAHNFPQCSKDLGPLTALFASAERAQILVRVDASIVGVAPEKAQSIVTLCPIVYEEHAFYPNYVG